MHRLWSNRVAAMAPIPGWSRAAKARPEKNRTSSKDHWSMFCGGQWSSTPLPSRKGYLKQIGKEHDRTELPKQWNHNCWMLTWCQTSPNTQDSQQTFSFAGLLWSAHCHRDLIKEVAVLYIVIKSNSKVLSCWTIVRVTQALNWYMKVSPSIFSKYCNFSYLVGRVLNSGNICLRACFSFGRTFLGFGCESQKAPLLYDCLCILLRCTSKECQGF